MILIYLLLITCVRIISLSSTTALKFFKYKDISSENPKKILHYDELYDYFD